MSFELAREKENRALKLERQAQKTRAIALDTFESTIGSEYTEALKTAATLQQESERLKAEAAEIRALNTYLLDGDRDTKVKVLERLLSGNILGVLLHGKVLAEFERILNRKQGQTLQSRLIELGY